MKNENEITTVIIDGRIFEIGFNDNNYIPPSKIFCDYIECIDTPKFGMNVVAYWTPAQKKFFEFYLCYKCHIDLLEHPTKFVEHAESRL